jgi:ribosomal protein S8
MAKKTLIQRWREEGLAPELAHIMQSAVFARAMEIVKEHTEPNDLVIQRVYRENPVHADQIISSMHKMQAGERRVWRMLKWLSEVQPETNGAIPEPFQQYDEQYFEPRQ